MIPAALLLVPLLVPSPATLRVGPGSLYPTIGQAVAAAGPGDTIVVGAGAYDENVVLARSVSLRGEGWPVIRGRGTGNTILIEADDVLVEGFVVTGSGPDMMASDAGIRVRGDRARLRGNRLERNLFGIYLDGCEEALLEGNVVTGKREDDLGSRGAGIHLYDSRRNRIAGNVVSDVRDGVYFDHSDDNLVEDNDFHHLRYGIHYMFCADNRFFGNVLRDSVGGAAVMYTERVVFRDNRMVGNRDGHNAFGLLLKDCEDSLAERNVIVDNVNGIFLDSAHRNRFERNLVAFNDVALLHYASAMDNDFTRNDFIANGAILHTVGRAHSRWTPPDGGNYFSDYRGFDLDGDGAGDVPHRLQDAFEHLAGNHPLMRLYLQSAAADALAAAERTFPVIPSSEEQDTAPRMRPASGARIPARPVRGRLVFSMGALATLGLVLLGLWRLGR